jgi:glutamate-ammonia-ligase adenylyltransferase
MVADEQTHILPDDEAGVKNIAEFMGYETVSEFSEVLLNYLYAVHEIYANSFRSSAEDLGDTGNLVFTGVSSDEETLKTLREMGYENPEVVSEIVMGWHHGSSRATRTKRARELLTEMMPAILKRLSETANPDTAFLKFNEFLKNLPAAVQLFSLFQMNPQLLGLIAEIMGSAPSLAESLSHNPELLDAVLYADFYSGLPSSKHLQEMLSEKMQNAEDFEDRMDILRKFRNEKRFQAGVQLLKNLINAHQASDFLSNLAELMVSQTCALATAEFEQTYGQILGSRFAIIALGKLGSREMTFSSDLDLVFVYDTPDFDALSNGEKQFTASVYYNRFAQRLMNALSGMGRDGRLYEVDTRLRPSGKQGLLAVSTKALTHYFTELAWTFEYMAFTKARAVAGDASLIDELEIFIGSQLTKDRDGEKLRADVADMRERMAKEFASENPWDIKNIRGGLTDIDFIAQYLLLLHAPNLVGVNSGSAREIFTMLERASCIDREFAETLITANDFLGQLFNMLRLCSDKKFTEETAPEGLKKLLTQSVKMKDFTDLKEKLLKAEELVFGCYKKLLS